MKIVTPTLGGVLGAAQLSTLGLLLHPESSTNVLLTGAASGHLLWSVPVGLFMGATLAWLLMRLWGRPDWWREWRGACLRAVIPGFVLAPFSPGFLGLGPQTTAQLLTGLALLTGMEWSCLFVITQIERHHLLKQEHIKQEAVERVPWETNTET